MGNFGNSASIQHLKATSVERGGVVKSSRRGALVEVPVLPRQGLKAAAQTPTPPLASLQGVVSCWKHEHAHVSPQEKMQVAPRYQGYQGSRFSVAASDGNTYAICATERFSIR